MKRLLVIGILIFGSSTIFSAGKKKKPDGGPKKEQSLDEVLAAVKALDKQKQKQEADAQKKESLIKQEHEKKYTLTEFLGSTYKEPKNIYHKRLQIANDFLKKSKEELEIFGQLIMIVQAQSTILNNKPFVLTEQEIILPVTAHTAEAISLMHHMKALINGVKALFKPNFRLIDFEEHISKEQREADRKLLLEYLIRDANQNINIDLWEVANALLVANDYYDLVMREKELVTRHVKLDTLVRDFPASGCKTLQKNLHDLTLKSTRDFVSLYHRADKVVSQEIFDCYFRTCASAHKSLERYLESVQKELQFIEQDLKKQSQQKTVAVLQRPKEKEKLEVMPLAKPALHTEKKEQIASNKEDQSTKLSASIASPDNIQSAIKHISVNKQDSGNKNIKGDLPSHQKSSSESVNKVVKTIAQARVLEPKKIISFYPWSTVLDWFYKPQEALQRSIEKYPQANRTRQQQVANIIAHTHPFEMDNYIKTLAAHEIRLEDNSTEYYVPGSILNHETDQEQTGYFSYVVKEDGCCVHRSFTLRDYTQDNLEDYEHPLIKALDQEETFEAKIPTRKNLKILQSNLALHFVTDKLTYKMCIVK